MKLIYFGKEGPNAHAICNWAKEKFDCKVIADEEDLFDFISNLKDDLTVLLNADVGETLQESINETLATVYPHIKRIYLSETKGPAEYQSHLASENRANGYMKLPLDEDLLSTLIESFQISRPGPDEQDATTINPDFVNEALDDHNVSLGVTEKNGDSKLDNTVNNKIQGIFDKVFNDDTKENQDQNNQQRSETTTNTGIELELDSSEIGFELDERQDHSKSSDMTSTSSNTGVELDIDTSGDLVLDSSSDRKHQEESDFLSPQLELTDNENNPSVGDITGEIDASETLGTTSDFKLKENPHQNEQNLDGPNEKIQLDKGLLGLDVSDDHEVNGSLDLAFEQEEESENAITESNDSEIIKPETPSLEAEVKMEMDYLPEAESPDAEIGQEAPQGSDVLEFRPQDDNETELLSEGGPHFEEKSNNINISNRPDHGATQAYSSFLDNKKIHDEVMAEHDNELVKLSSTISNLRAERDELYEKIENVEDKVDRTKRENLSLKAQLDEAKIELSLSKKRHAQEKEMLNYDLEVLSEKVDLMAEKEKKWKSENEQLRRKVKVDLNKIYQREKYLEDQLDLMKIDSDSKIVNRENKILELKRRIDTLEFDMEQIYSGEKKAREIQGSLEFKLEKVLNALKLTTQMLEEESQEFESAPEFKKVSLG